MTKNEFFVGTDAVYVAVSSPIETARSFIEDEIGGFFNVTTDLPLHSLQLARVEHVIDEEMCRDMERVVDTTTTSQFLMHDPKNTPRERRHGAIGVDYAGRVVCRSITEGSLILACSKTNLITVCNPRPEKALKEIRRIVRDQLLVRALESRGGLTVHSACIVDAVGRAVLVVGRSGSGKTAFFLEALSRAPYLSALTCERTLIVRGSRGLTPLGIPEKVNIFPGSLRQYPQTAYLAGELSISGDWLREHKRKIAWRILFAAFGAELPEDSPAFVGVLFPEYAVQRRRAERIGREEARERLMPEILTFDDHIRPNWLSWYHPSFAHTLTTMETVLQLPTYSMAWNSQNDVYEGMSQVLEG